MTLGELLGPEANLPPGLARVSVTGLTADSRAVEPGFLFAALPGVKADGTEFIAEALRRGAAAILAPQGVAHPVSQAPIIEDADPRSEEHTSELLSLMRNSYAAFCLNTKKEK